MRIALISQYFWPEEFRINAICQELTKAGHHVEVLTSIPNYPGGRYFDGYSLRRKRREDYNGIPVWRVPVVPRGRGGALRMVLNYASFAFFGRRMRCLRRFADFDISLVYAVSPITQVYPAIRLKKKFGVPVCLYVLDLWPESLTFGGGINNKTILRAAKRMVAGIYEKCDGLLISSRGFADSISKFGVPKEKMRYLPNWAEEEYCRMSRSESADEVHLDESGKFVVMYAGNIGEAQGLDSILDAAHILREKDEIAFVILGGGRRFEEVQRIARERALGNIRFLGKKPVAKMSAYFSQADVMLATLKDHPAARLTLPGRIVSFMVCGKPVICSIQGETSDIIEEADAGICCEADSGAALAQAVLRAYEMPKDALEEMGERGHAYARLNFDKDKLMETLIGFLSETAER